MSIFASIITRPQRVVWVCLVFLFSGFAPWVHAASVPLTLEVAPTDPMLPEKATTTDVLKQGFKAQLKFGGNAQLSPNITDVVYGQWTVTSIKLRPSNGSQQLNPEPVFEEVAGISDHSQQTLTLLRFGKPGHWSVTVSANAGYKRDGVQQTPISNTATVEIDIIAQPLKIIINNTEDKFGRQKDTDDFVPVGVQNMPRPYTLAEIKLGSEGFPSGSRTPQEVKVKVSAGGALRNEDGNADWTESTIQLIPGGPAKKFKLFGMRASSGWDGDFIEAQLVNPPSALRNAAPVKEDFTAFELKKGVVWGTREVFNPDTGNSGVNNVNADPDVPDNYAEESPRIVVRKVAGSPLATIRLGAVLSPEVPWQGRPSGGISHEVIVKAMGNRFVWTLDGSNGYAQGDYKGYGSSIGVRLQKWQTAGLDWRVPASRDAGPRIEIITRGGKAEMPVDNTGFGEMVKADPMCELRWPTTLRGSNVKVAEVKGQVPQLFFQRLRNDNPGKIFNVAGQKERAANWFYYWAVEQKGPCSYSVKSVRYENPINYKGTTTAWGIFRNGKISLSGRTVTDPGDWTFPRDPNGDTAGWVNAGWQGIEGPGFVNLAFAHESTHQSVAGIRGQKDEDQDGIPSAWEKDVAGMNPQNPDSFQDHFLVSKDSDAHRDEEFYCTLGGAVGIGTVTGKCVYHGKEARDADETKDWSVNGFNW